MVASILLRERVLGIAAIVVFLLVLWINERVEEHCRRHRSEYDAVRRGRHEAIGWRDMQLLETLEGEREESA